MSRDWKPGDVAVMKCLDLDCSEAIHTGILARSGEWWLLDLGEYVGSRDVEPVRPLVVIDPEDMEQVSRLGEAMDPVHWYGSPGYLQAVLREFANPTPPKPDEPTGLGAVVEDAEGKQWVRVWNARVEGKVWTQGLEHDGRSIARHYSDIAVVRVLSEGIS